MSNEQQKLITDLLDQLPPDTPGEVDAELRAAGLDPERIEQEAADLIEKLSQQYGRRARRWDSMKQYIQSGMLKIRLRWYVRQILPLRYESRYREGGKPILCIWRMWLGRCFNVRSFVLADEQ